MAQSELVSSRVLGGVIWPISVSWDFRDKNPVVLTKLSNLGITVVEELDQLVRCQLWT